MINLPEFTHKNRIKLVLIGCCLFSFIYLGAANFSFREIQQAPLINLDERIQWMPWTVIVYLSQFGFLIVALIYAPNNQIATRTYYGYLLATLLAGCIFILYPTCLPQKNNSSLNLPILIHLLYQLLYLTDVPRNCLPSLHTTLALLATKSLVHRGFFWRIVASLWGGSIVVSTLTTKQHCILDVLAGVLLFGLCDFLCGEVRWRNYNQE